MGSRSDRGGELGARSLPYELSLARRTFIVPNSRTGSSVARPGPAPQAPREVLLSEWRFVELARTVTTRVPEPVGHRRDMTRSYGFRFSIAEVDRQRLCDFFLYAFFTSVTRASLTG